MCGTLLWMGDNDGARAAGQRALALATAVGDLPLVAQAQARLGNVYRMLGDYARALEWLRQAVEATPSRAHLGTASPFPVLFRTFLLWSLAEVGAFTEGETHGAEGVRIAEAGEHLTNLSLAAIGVGRLCLWQGDVHRAVPVLEQGLRRCEVIQSSTYFLLTASSLGYAYALAGRVAEALSLLERVLEEAERSGGLQEQALYVAWLSEASLLAGRREEASAGAARALALARAQQERGHEAWALRLLGEIAARGEPLEVVPAETHYQQALALAEELGMRPLQAHCHRGLGMLYGRTGQREQARTALLTAVELYRAMEMTFWLPETEVMLAQVDGR
jgi:tetratricopeptide (TPR) repeat protein